MTRINCIPVECLTDKHLLAEYKEITRPFNKVLKRIEKGTMDKISIPENYRLGAGHETFFFDKLKFLHIRYSLLYSELVRRGFSIDVFKFSKISGDLLQSFIGTSYWNDYDPTPEDMYLNMARLAKRSNLQTVENELENRYG